MFARGERRRREERGEKRGKVFGYDVERGDTSRKGCHSSDDDVSVAAVAAD